MDIIIPDKNYVMILEDDLQCNFDSTCKDSIEYITLKHYRSALGVTTLVTHYQCCKKHYRDMTYD